MSDPVYIPLDRTDVITYLGSAWPPRPGEPLLTLPDTSGITDGAAIVYPVPGRPGIAWWVVDSAVCRQDAGTPDEVLAALLPGSVLGSVPAPTPPPDTPPEN